MSKTQLYQFLERCAEDSELRAELPDEQLTAEKVAAFAARHGFSFSAEELLNDVTPLTDKTWADAAQLFDSDHSDNYILFLEEIPMSKEALNAFFKKVAEDEALQKKLIEFAATQGFEFSADELNDSDLDSVAGGLLLSPLAGKLETLRNLAGDGLIDHKVERLASIQDDGMLDVKVENVTDL